MATALATVSDMNDRMDGVATDTGRATAILQDVSAHVRALTRQTISEDTTTDRLRTVFNRVTLPQRPATAITSVQVDGEDVDYVWDGLQRIDISAAYPPYAAVDVTYVHGYATGHDVLEAVAGLVATIAARVYGVPPETGGKRQETMGAYSYTIGSSSAAGGFGILPSELKALRSLVGASVQYGSIDTSPLGSLS